MPNRFAQIFTHPFSLILGLILLILLGSITAFHFLFWEKINPGIKIAGIDVSGKTKQEALQELENIAPPQIILTSNNQDFVFTPDDLKIKYLKNETVQNAYEIGRRGNVITTTTQKLKGILEDINIPLSYTLEEDILEEIISDVSQQVSKNPIEPSVVIQKGKIIVDKGQDGKVLEKDVLREQITETIAYIKKEPLSILLKEVALSLTDNQAIELEEKAKKLLGKKIELAYEKELLSYPDTELVTLLSADSLNEAKVQTLAKDIAQGINRTPQDARFVFEGGKVNEFAPGKPGISIDEEKLALQIEEATNNLLASENQKIMLQLPYVATNPSITTEEVNNLGIKELIGKGSSTFKGSIASRVHNIALAANRINGLLIKPGEEFSFNNTLGDISSYTGYQQAYIIKDGRTVLGDGGGVCQVSTTVFRATLNSGLPITARKAHAYRVSYYEQDLKPGIDATVFSPSVDFRFKNDTPGHILIQANADTKNLSLVIEFYGTSDGRVAEISTPRIWDFRPAPPPLYQDDPTLPAGVVKQVDFAAPGAKASFDYKVIRNGETLQERTFVSNYRPWQAVYLRGIGEQ